MRQYRGVTIDRVPGSGYYKAFPECSTDHPSHYVPLMADTEALTTAKRELSELGKV
jgi:hypothetical protein